MTRAILVLVFLALAACDRLDDAKKCEEGTGDLDLDIEHCTRAINSGDLSDESLVNTFINRGDTYFNKGEYDRAIQDYDQAIELKPDHALAFNNRGFAYHEKGEYDRAIADYDRAIQLNPDYAYAFGNRGDAYDHKGEYDRAIADYDQVIRLKPDHALAFYNRGIAYRLKGEYDRAIRDYDQAIRLNPDDAIAYDNKASALNGKAWELATSRSAYERDGLEAVRLADEAVRINDKPSYRDTLAAAYAEAGRFADAVAEQERVIEMAQAAGMHDQIADLQSRLDLYRRRQAYRE